MYNGDQYLEDNEYLLYKNWTRWTRVKAWVTEQDADPSKGWVYNRYIRKVRCDSDDMLDDSGSIRPESLQ
jgi:hypothetical protein